MKLTRDSKYEETADSLPPGYALALGTISLVELIRALSKCPVPCRFLGSSRQLTKGLNTTEEAHRPETSTAFTVLYLRFILASDNSY